MKKKPPFEDPKWNYFGSISVHDETDEDIEEELSWLLRDIQTHIRGVPRSALIKLRLASLKSPKRSEVVSPQTLQSLKQWKNNEEYDECSGIFAFYAVVRK